APSRPASQVPMPGIIPVASRWLVASAVAAGGLAVLLMSAGPGPDTPPARHAARPATGPATQPATRPVHPFRSNVKVDVTDDFFIVHSNGLPDHDTGPFPNPRNPNTIREQNYTFKIPR